MDKEVSPGTMAAIVAVVVLLLGFVAWRVFGNRGPSAQEQQLQQQQIREDYMRRMPPGQAPAGVPPPGGR